MEQWLLRIQTLTDIKLEEIGILKGRESIDKKKIDGKKIFIAIHRTLESVIENDPRRLDKFCKDHGIGIKVYDEAHFELKSIFTIDSFTDVPFTMYLTATASRTDWKEDRLFKYIIPINELERFGGGAEKVHKSHRYHKFKFISYRTNTLFSEQAALQGRRGFDLNRWATNTLRDNRKEVFTTAVIDEIKRIDAMTQPEGTTEWPPRHCIVLKSLEQCKEFKLALSEYGDENVGMFSGITKDQKERYQELTKHIIIATEKSIGTAIDSDIDVLHCTVPMSSKSWFYQMVGRLRQHRMALFIGYVDVSIEACEVIGRIQKKLAKKISVSIDEDVATTVITPVTFAEEEKEHVDVSLPKKKPQKKKKIVVPDESEDIAAEVSEPEEEISTVIPRPMISRTKGTPKKPIRLLPKGK
jgi:superfamily II DNA or RNA helicase